MQNRPHTTLFLLQSLDGKISTGDNDERDFDTDLATIPGIKEGLNQYYELEQQTDPVSLITGRVMAKIGANTQALDTVNQIPITSVVIDNKPHLTKHGVEFLLRKFEKIIIVTTNNQHPAYTLQSSHTGLTIIHYNHKINFADLFERLSQEHGAKRVTIQSGGELNAILLRAGLIDTLLIVVAPCLVGGRNTTTLIGGESLRTSEDLAQIRPLRLTRAQPLKDSYVKLEYEVIN